MTFTVSISEFRNNLSEYLEKVSHGTTILVRDEKKDRVVAEVVGKKEFDPVAFRRSLKAAAGVFTAKNHPEWRTKKDVIKWLEKERSAADRTF